MLFSLLDGREVCCFGRAAGSPDLLGRPWAAEAFGVHVPAAWGAGRGAGAPGEGREGRCGGGRACHFSVCSACDHAGALTEVVRHRVVGRGGAGMSSPVSVWEGLRAERLSSGRGCQVTEGSGSGPPGKALCFLKIILFLFIPGLCNLVGTTLL